MKKRTGKISGIIIAIIYMFAFAAIGAYSASFAESYLGEEETTAKSMIIVLIYVIMAYIGAMIHIAVHEAGHLIFGKLTGYEFKSYRIFNLMWQKDKDEKVRFYKYSLAGTGGQCMMGPPEMKDDEMQDMPFVLYNLGGIIMNLVVSLIFFGFFLLQKETIFFKGFCIVMLIIGISYVLVNGIPLPASTNDGSNTLSIARSKKARKAFWVQMKGVILLTEGTRIKDFPKEWFSMPDEKGLQNTMEAVMAVYVCDRLMDEHRFKEAKKTMAQLLNANTAINEIHRKMLKTNALYCELLRMKEEIKNRNEENKETEENLKDIEIKNKRVTEDKTLNKKTSQENERNNNEKNNCERNNNERSINDKRINERNINETNNQETNSKEINNIETDKKETDNKEIENKEPKLKENNTIEEIKENIRKYLDKDLEQFWKAMKKNPSVIRTQYAYEKIYEQNEEKAGKCLDEFEKAAKVYPYPVEIEAEREFLYFAL